MADCKKREGEEGKKGEEKEKKKQGKGNGLDDGSRRTHRHRVQ